MAVAGGLVVLGVGALASSALAASVAPRPFGGPTGCGALSQQFGGGAAWTEIRFSSLPEVGGTKTGSAQGVTVTITRTAATTISWQASDGVDLVWVNAGEPPNGSSAAYVYAPEATSDSGLSGITGQDPLDHVLVCFDPDAVTTTTEAATTTEPATTAPPVTAPASTEPPTQPPTTDAPTVLSSPAITAAVPRQSGQVPATPAEPVTAAALQLPETGFATAPLVGLGVTLLGLGLVTLAFLRRAPEPDDA